jgi:signal transduction histidine kinase
MKKTHHDDHPSERIPIRRGAVDIRELLAATLDVLRDQARSVGIAVEVAVDEVVPREVALDGVKTAWAVSTLVGNALRYLGRGGRAGRIEVRAGYERDTRTLVISVKDDGPGIPASRASRLFEDAGALRSVGLALVLVRDVVAAHGGTIDVHSKTEQGEHGTHITLRIPTA